MPFGLQLPVPTTARRNAPYAAAWLMLIILFPRVSVAQIPSKHLYEISSPPALQYGAGLGKRVVVSGRFTVVAAPCDDYLGLDVGLVKVFDSSSGAFLYTLTNPLRTKARNFGVSMAQSGKRIVVGSTNGACVFDLTGEEPSIPVVTFEDRYPYLRGRFGASVAICGDKVVIGSPYAVIEGETAGIAFAYDLTREDPTLHVRAFGNPFLSTSGDFGENVAISDAGVLITVAGRVCLFEFDGGSTSPPVAYLRTLPLGANVGFSGSLAISGERVIAGANSESGKVVYVYELGGQTQDYPVRTLETPSFLESHAQYGGVVAIDGARVVVGAYVSNPSFPDSGKVFVYDLEEASPTEPLMVFSNHEPAEGDQYGFSLDISGATLAVGAPGDDGEVGDSGSAFVYDLTRTPPDLYSTLELVVNFERVCGA